MTQSIYFKQINLSSAGDRVKELFNFITVGFYWELFDEKGDTSYANKYMNDNLQWADKNNLRVKGHPLLWHESLPNWIIDFERGYGGVGENY